MGYKLVLFFICVFLIAFPKGGVKIGDIPVTWGYILLALYASFAAFSIVDNDKNVYVTAYRRKVLTYCLPFQLYSLIILSLSDIKSTGFALSFILSIIIMPLIFLIFFNRFFDSKKFEKTFTPIFINCLRFVSIFGVILFFLKYFTGKDFEIPYLTVNIDDVGQISEKFNLRGTITKLISTYNNGNIYGVSLMILLPLYMQAEKSLIFKAIVLLSLVLTLSRTVWVGLIIYMFLYFITKINSRKAWMAISVATVFAIIAGPIILSAMGRGTDFLMDRDLGGRTKQLEENARFSFFGSFEFLHIEEIIYASIFKTFGFIGLLLFLPYLFSPFIIYYSSPTHKRDIASSKGVWGLILYCILALSDGAMLYIPVMCFYWFLASYIFKKPNYN